MKKIAFGFVCLAFLSCSQPKNTTKSPTIVYENFSIKEVSTDENYGLTSKKPVEVGGASESRGPQNERRYLDLLAGPKGEKISYNRAGSCCRIKSNKGLMGYAMLDNYRVSYEGSKDTVSIYINMYDKGELKAPMGFTIKKD